MARITAPRSRIYECYFPRSPCPKCGDLLSAPAHSEFLRSPTFLDLALHGVALFRFSAVPAVGQACGVGGSLSLFARHQIRQLGDVHRDPPRLVARE